MEAQAAVLIGTWTLVALIVVALAFDFMNGFHDGANSIATIVATGALTPKQAVLFAAAFNFLALWVFQLKVAATIGKGTIDPAFVDHYVIFGCLVGALAWNIITWYYGIPSSSSHALIGGLVGATVAKIGGTQAIIWGSLWQLKGFITIICFIVRVPHRWNPDGDHRLGVPQPNPLSGRALVHASPAGVRRPLLPRPRRQRRPEDHRHHLAAPDHRGGQRGPADRACGDQGGRDAADVGGL